MNESLNIDKMWRSLLTGELHVYFANYIVSVFHDILSVCESYGILSTTQSNQAKLNATNINDLSDAVKLINSRFDTVLKSKNGRELTITLPSAIQIFIHSDASNSCSRSDIEILRKSAYKGLQFEVICKQISYSRNLNAHSNMPIDDLGHASMLASSFLRLQEIFEPPTESEKNLKKMNHLCCLILEQASISLSLDKSRQRADFINTFIEKKYSDKQVVNIETQNLSIEEDSEVKITEKDEKSISIDADYPIQYDSKLKTRELKKQRLLLLRRELLKFMAKEMSQVKRSKCILTNQSINELLSVPISSFEDMLNLPSFSYNFDVNKKISECQYFHIESELLDILVC